MKDIKTNSGADAPERIVTKLIGEVPDYLDADAAEIEVFSRFIGCDLALEYMGDSKGIDPFSVICKWGNIPAMKGKLWLWSIKVIRDKRKIPPVEDKGCALPLSSPVILAVRA